MKVGVTGGTGFIGQRLVRQLREAGHDVVCVVRRPEAAAALGEVGATLARGDILDRASLLSAFAGCEGVIHVAASYELGLTKKRAAEALKKNIEGTETALKAAVEAGAKKIVYTSSIAIYGDTAGRAVVEGHREASPRYSTFYASTKARAHEVAERLIADGAPIVIVQPGAVHGVGDHSVHRALWWFLARGLPAPIGPAFYGHVDVDDCARGHILALEKGRIGESYHLVAENLSLPELVERAARVSGLPNRSFVQSPRSLEATARITAFFERFLPIPDFLSAEANRGCYMGSAADTEKARRELGFDPGPLDDTLRAILSDQLRRAGRPLPPALALPPSATSA
jgi:dihydroflavonol-4-reductase